MFSDRFRWLKAALAAAAFAALCRQARTDVESTEVHLEQLPTRHETLRGRPVSASAKRVLSADADGIVFDTPAGPLRLLGQTSPAAGPGDVVSAVGVVSGPREIRADRLRIHPGFAWKRPLNYAVSALVLAAFLAGAVRRFGLRLPLPLFRSRH